MRTFFIILLLWPALLSAQIRYASETLKLRAGASDAHEFLRR